MTNETAPTQTITSDDAAADLISRGHHPKDVLTLIHAQCRIDDAALCGAKRKYPDPRPRLGIAGLAHLADCETCARLICETCARLIAADHAAALGSMTAAQLRAALDREGVGDLPQLADE